MVGTGTVSAAPSQTDPVKEDRLPKGYPNSHPICSIPGCNGRHHSRGWCDTHYSRWQVHGSPEKLVKASPKQSLLWLEDQILNRERTDECWFWPFGLTKDGYGSLHFDGKSNQRASRVTLVLAGHPIPPFPNNQALHSCDNRPCVNPKHLRWGSHTDNMRDMAERGRSRSYRGGKLTPSQVRSIRTSRQSTTELAKVYDVTWETINNVLRRHTWNDLE